MVEENAQRPAENDATSPAKPVANYRYGTISAAVFEDKKKASKGTIYPDFRIDLRRSYRKIDGSYGHTHSIRIDHIPAAIEALKRCHIFIAAAQDGNVPGLGELPEE